MLRHAVLCSILFMSDDDDDHNNDDNKNDDDDSNDHYDDNNHLKLHLITQHHTASHHVSFY